MNVPEAAEYLRLSPSTIRKMIAADELKSTMLRGQIRILKEDLDALFEAHD
ncbi:helix-turn-helix domain-containing protein [Nocardioides piscis]|uniref:Helix-turn-helix domain-containing protein n=1 Tax=Nocardioides piscis TaxID=2714938 RepID=A0A6G7YBX0_9ACTN|nr:helix-turn-helix domain-containing protein [Nocardioides piscis]QIK74107.1 helix-turn-helix domain-containing protein [Nocardioides piscis]